MRACVIPEATTERLDRFQARAVALRIPLEGTLELTRRCNLRCVHCYLGAAAGAAQAGTELTAAGVRSVIAQLAAAGTLHLTLTGGEPLLRADFAACHAAATDAGMFVTVFTNATRVDARVVRLFRERPPRRVEVTVHGASRAVYEAITRVPGSFLRFRRGVGRLLAAGVRVSFKTVVMRPNLHEIDAIESWARECGAPFRYDTALFPGFPDARGAQRPDAAAVAGLRVEPREAVDLDAATPARSAPWLAALRRDPPPDTSRLIFRCGAGLTNFHVDHEGVLTPCLMIADVRHDLKTGDFATGWNGPIAALRRAEARPGFPCGDCAAGALCAACPALFTLEGGAPDRVAPYHCATGRERSLRLAGRGIIEPQQEAS